MSRKISLKVGAPIPDSLGPVVDAYREVRDLRLAMDKEVKEVKARETELYNHLVENLSSSDTTGAAGLRYRAQIVTDEVPVAEDWEDIYDYVVEHDRFDLMGKSLSKSAVKEMLSNGEHIPGVGTMIVKKVSVTKL